MKRFLVVLFPLLLLSIILHAQKGAQQKTNHSVTAIAFYNFENLFDTLDDPYHFDEDFTPSGAYHYNSKIYNAKLHNLAIVLEQLGNDVTPDGPALIGTAEVENGNVLRDLALQPEIINRAYKYVHFDGGDTRGIDCGLLYNPKYFTVLSAQSLPVDISNVSKIKNAKTRDVLYVTGMLTTDTVHVFVNHWPSRRGGESVTAPLRSIAAGVSKRVIDSLMLRNPNSKVILMGDLNDDPINESVAKILGAKSSMENVEQSGLYNPFYNYYTKGIGSLAYNDAWNLFDQIIVSKSLLKSRNKSWSFYKAEVFNKEFLKTKFGRFKGYPHRSFSGTTWLNGYSDHFPTLIYLVKP